MSPRIQTASLVTARAEKDGVPRSTREDESINSVTGSVTRDTHAQLSGTIPQVLHYCWFGGNPKPDIVRTCIASWELHMPGWEIIEWNESNYNVSKCAYALEAYEAGKWAFVSDYARFDILQQYGGIYLDTDAELLKPIPSWVLRDEAFTGMESSGLVSPGLIFGCVRGLPLLSPIVESYHQSHFVTEERLNQQTVNQRVTEILELRGFRRADVNQRVAGVTIYPSEYFCGYDQDIHEPRITENTISMHHYAHSWGGQSDLRRLQRQQRLKGIIGKSAYRRLLACKRRFFGVRGA